MKKIINGKKYDTETALKLGRSINRTETILYCKKNEDEFFFYDTFVDNNVRDYSIRPVTKEEAQQWSQGFLETDKYESLFGVVDE